MPAESAFCPSCGASLELSAEQQIMPCTYCGGQSMVVRRLRRVEPEIPLAPPPPPKPDPSKDFSNWGTERLCIGVLTDPDLQRRIEMAKALDQWYHTNETAAKYAFLFAEMMQTCDKVLDKAACGILGKLICSDDLRFKAQVIAAAEKYAFRVDGSHGLVFALSLGDAGTVKILLDIAEHAASRGGAEYAQQALFGVQTAIDRAGNDIPVCDQILVNRLPYATGQTREWILKHLHLQFDVGYRHHLPFMLDLIDDMAAEKPDLVPLIENSMRRAGGASNGEQYRDWLRLLPRWRSDLTRRWALGALASPPYGFGDAEVNAALTTMPAWLAKPEYRNAAGAVLAGVLHMANDVPPALDKFVHENAATLPAGLVEALAAKTKR